MTYPIGTYQFFRDEFSLPLSLLAFLVIERCRYYGVYEEVKLNK